jgi:hypothetical protein
MYIIFKPRATAIAIILVLAITKILFLFMVAPHNEPKLVICFVRL